MVKTMPFEKIDYNLTSNNRTDIRKELTELFLDEEHGNGTGELSSKYWYIVEQYDDLTIVLKRPAVLNKGFDFTVNVEECYFKGKGRRHKNPGHDDIVNIFSYIKRNYPTEYEKVANQIRNIFEIKDYCFDEIKHIKFLDGDGIERPIGIALLAIKWLFIEQDITYWNWSGRNMLMNGLEEKGLV